MASLQLAPYTGARRKVVVGAGEAVEAEVRVEEIDARGSARFAYDLQSYRQNFDDGLASSGRPPYRRL
nr:unnamed protein product [Digitaria exilis]